MRNPVPKQPSHSAKNIEGDFGAFESALRKVLSAPHEKIKAELEAEKRRKLKRASASRASRANH